MSLHEAGYENTYRTQTMLSHWMGWWQSSRKVNYSLVLHMYGWWYVCVRDSLKYKRCYQLSLKRTSGHEWSARLVPSWPTRVFPPWRLKASCHPFGNKSSRSLLRNGWLFLDRVIDAPALQDILTWNEWAKGDPKAFWNPYKSSIVPLWLLLAMVEGCGLLADS